MKATLDMLWLNVQAIDQAEKDITPGKAMSGISGGRRRMADSF
jgi:hypothetical protein